jgi:DNA-binding MarR family transcriptional regulator
MQERLSIDAYVIDVLMRDLAGHDHKPSSFLVYLLLLRLAGTGKRDTVSISLQSIASKTGLSKSTVQGALRHLKARGFLDPAVTASTSDPRRRVLRPWQRATSPRS